MQHWLGKWFTSSNKEISNNNDDLLLLEISVMFNFLASQVNDIEEKASFQRQVKKFCKKKSEKQIEAIPNFYLFLEQYLLEVNKPTRHSKEGLRSLICKEYPSIQNLENCQIIFEKDKNKQKILLAKEFLLGVIKSSKQILGATEENMLQKTSQWLNAIPQNILTEVPFNLEIKKDTDWEELINLFINISHILFRKISARFSENFTEKFYKDNYQRIAEKYKNLEGFSVILELFPNQILDSDQVNLLSKNQIQKMLLEKLDLLENTLAQLKEKNEEFHISQEKLIKSEADLSKQNTKIQDSIRYAKRIQQAMLVKQEKVLASFDDAFIFFKPRDVVSGDFYWFAEDEQRIFIAAVDCTGHGVPGALLSMISNNLLNEIVHRRKIKKTDEILNNLEIGITKALQQEETKNRDGLDIALCMINKKENILEFSGAKRPLIYIENGELFEIKGDRKSIGGHNKNVQVPNFTSHQMSLNPNRAYYLFSDGYSDQFGGEETQIKKFMLKRFKKLLLNNSKEKMINQKEILEKTLSKWKAETEQTDDILVLGFKTS